MSNSIDDCEVTSTKVSVIIPMYGVEQFVGRCAESLLTQTLDDIELIFVDDHSIDAGVSVVKSFISNHPEYKGVVKILQHEYNKGLPAARNTGLANASGEYVFHCDGDDWLEPDALERLYTIAKKNNADFVWCDWYLSYENRERTMPQPDYFTRDEMLRNGLLGGGMKYNVWNKLVRRNLYIDNHILFPEGRSMGEDMTMIMLGACATRIAHCDEPLYHYVKVNTGAMTQTLNDKKLDDIVYNVERMIQFIDLRYPKQYTKEFSWFKMNAKLPLLLEFEGMYEKWQTVFPVSNAECMFNHNVSIRTRLIQFFAAHRLWLLITLYRRTMACITGLVFEG